MKFEDLGLAEPILRAVTAEGYTTPTPIQVQAIPQVLEGHDLLGCAQTGTGKTAAFALPILHRLMKPTGSNGRIRPIRTLVLSPTRELASQIGESFRVYGAHTGLRELVIYGGVGQGRQVAGVRHGVDVLVATPGRLLDLMNQGHIDLSTVEVLVLDEADRMLDMGFINDIRKIVAKVPKTRQTLFFSATMPPDIRKLADAMLNKPVLVQVARESAAADNVEQSVYFLKRRNKPALLNHLLGSTSFTRSLIFTRTRRGANKVVSDLEIAGVRCEAIHSNKSQNARLRAMDNFKSGKTRVLVATDIAARGLDIDEISHVVNYDMPDTPETYVHRIGRTARAGASGFAVSFCDSDERSQLNAIERLICKTITVVREHPEYAPSGASNDAADRPRSSPIHNPGRPRQATSRQHGRADNRDRNAHAPQRDQASYGKPRRKKRRGGRPGHSGQSAAAAHHGRGNQPAPQRDSDGRSAPKRDTTQRPAAHAGGTATAQAKPTFGSTKHRSRRRRR
ncbi:hypothetical protein B7486_05070 [cyanobacterium TDX16]|nr:hypothetical protein B7486_05070 [cyanobacterium TDX16]